jgi:signal peptidase I
MNFAAILLTALLASGAVLLFDFLFSRRRKQALEAGGTLKEPVLVSYARSFFPVILLVLVLRSFLFEPFRIPSASMMPNLVDGDFIFVNKFAYGLRLPVVNTKVLSIGVPNRGDVIVFRLPSDPSTHYIKRLIGLPGDHIVVHDNRLIINGSPVPLESDGIYADGYGFNGSALGIERFGKQEYMVMFAPDRLSTDFDAVVPAGNYFFMGDNRNDSQDGRFPQVGFVPEGNLVGRASRIWLNWEFLHWPHWNRIGKKIN